MDSSTAQQQPKATQRLEDVVKPLPVRPYLDNAELDAFLTSQERDALAQLRQLKTGLEQESNHFLLYFILARKLDVQRTTDLLDNFFALDEKYNVRNFDPRDDSAVMQLLASGMAMSCPGLVTREGHAMSFILPRFFNDELNDVGANIRLGWFTFDRMFRDPDMLDSLRTGVAYVEDFEGSSFKMLASMSKNDSMKEMMQATQDAFPLRIRSIYLVNSPWWIRFMMALAKPFMKKKLRKKICVTNAQRIGQHIDPKYLLTSQGGSLTMGSPVDVASVVFPDLAQALARTLDTASS